MKKHIRTTLGKKILALYLVLFTVSLFFAYSAGYNYVYQKIVTDTQTRMWNAGKMLVNSPISQHDSISSPSNLEIQLLAASRVSECRILSIARDGKILIDTEVPTPRYNVNKGDTSFLHKKFITNFTMNGYLKEPSLLVTIPTPRSHYPDGYLIFTKTNTALSVRTDYYFNVLMMLFHLTFTVLGIVFLVLYITAFLPLRKLRNGAKDFSIAHENPPILIRTNDEYGDLAQTLNVIGAELSKFDEYQRKFISNISHDFRSPLTSIRGYIQAMIDGIIPPENQKKYLETILFETDRLTKLTTSLLDVNNFDKDNILLDSSEFDIHEVIEKVAAALEGRAHKKDIRLDVHPVQDVPLLVYGDSDKIHQVLQNLAENAIKFSDNHSVVSIYTRAKADRVFVCVKDAGIGIPKEDLPHIWERFYKTDLSRGKDKLGTGLGLSICKEIINAHQQTIDVVSTEGVGTEFIFTLSKV